MKVKRYLMVLMILGSGLVLSGCLNQITQSAGADISPALPGKVQNPWEQSAIKGDLGRISRLTVAYIPMNYEWIGDGIGYVVERGEEGSRETTFWRREVWPALFFSRLGGVEFPSAVVHPCGTHLIPLFINRGTEDLEGDFLILSGSQQFGHTTQGKIVFPLDVDRLISDSVFRNDFFALHPSPLQKETLKDHSPNTSAGQEFLQRIHERWPKIAEVKGVTYTVNPDALRALSHLTNHASYLDRVISQGGMVISPPLDPVSAAGMIPNILWNLGRAAGDKRLNGSFFEGGMYTGRDIGLTLGPYLACSAELLQAVSHDKAEKVRLLTIISQQEETIRQYEAEMSRMGRKK